MPNATRTDKLSALLSAIRGIHEQAGRHLDETDALDAADVLRSLQSACDVALAEFYGHDEQDAGLLWEPSAADVADLQAQAAVMQTVDWSEVPY